MNEITSISEEGRALIPQRVESPQMRAWARFKRHLPGYLSLWFLLLFVLFVLTHPFWGGGHAQEVTEFQYRAPGVEYWFGTDMHGRDVFSRVVSGSRVSLMIGAVGALISLLFGVLWGAVAGYLGGRWDNMMMRFVDIIYSLPSLIFVIVLITSLESIFKDWLESGFGREAAGHARLLFLLFGLGAVSWLTMARIVRGQVLSIKTRPYVEASRVLGGRAMWILRRHILPNITGIVIVYMMLTVPSVILYESFLSYLGLGIQPPRASLGSLIAEGASQINSVRVYWWMIVFPSGLLAVLLLSLNFLGDALKDALDPRADN